MQNIWFLLTFFLEENMWILIKVLQKVLIWFVKESRIEDDLINQTSFFFFFRNLVWEILFESILSKLYSWTWVNTDGVWYCCDLPVVVATYWKIEKKRGKEVGKSKITFTCCLFYWRFSLMCVTLVLVAFVHVFQSTYSLSLTSFPVWAFGWCWTACLFWSAKFIVKQCSTVQTFAVGYSCSTH